MPRSHAIPAPPLVVNEPRNMTTEEFDASVAWFALLPLAELRRRQDLTVAQMATAFEARNDRGLENLQAVELALAAGVWRREFGKEAGR